MARKLVYNRTRRLKDTVLFLVQLHGDACFFCKKQLGEEDVLSITKHHKNEDHFDDRPENWAPACEECHRRYHAKRILHKKSVASAKKECKRKRKS